MNKQQARHALAIAKHIRAHAESIVRSMDAINWANFEDIPVEVVEAKFNEVPNYLRSIQAVLDDMLGELEGQE